MNKLTKIGLSALAGSLVAISAHAGSMSVSGSASISFADGDTDNAGGTAAEANQWTMGDSLTFSGGGELDNGMSVAVKYEYDDDEGDLNGKQSDVLGPGFDSHSITLSSAEMGSITFAGHGGKTNMDNMDDKTPNAFEESWDGVSEADEETLVNGITGNNSFFYKAPSMGGATFSVAYVPQGETATPNGSYIDFGVVAKPEAIDGLEVGVAFGETEETTGTTVDEAAWGFLSMDRCCQSQLMAETLGQMERIPDEVAALTKNQVGSPIGMWMSYQPIYDLMLEKDDSFLS